MYKAFTRVSVPEATIHNNVQVGPGLAERQPGCGEQTPLMTVTPERGIRRGPPGNVLGSPSIVTPESWSLGELPNAAPRHQSDPPYLEESPKKLIVSRAVNAAKKAEEKGYLGERSPCKTPTGRERHAPNRRRKRKSEKQNAGLWL
jgi:hypothetical protein